MKKTIVNFLIKNKKIAASVGILLLVACFFIFENEKPTSLNGMMRKGESYLKEGKISLALESYLRAAKSYPNNYTVHMRLGELYIQVKESEKAKTEYYRAINLNHANNYDAYFALAGIYAEENKHNFVQSILSSLRDVEEKRIQERLGDFYYEWGKKLAGHDDFDSIRKYRVAYEFYSRSNNRKLNGLITVIENAYSKTSDELVKEGKINEAMKILGLSLDFNNNSLAHYKMARILESRNIDEAIKEYEKTFKMDSNGHIFDRSGYANLLVQKGNMYKEQGNELLSEYFYSKAKKISSRIKIPEITDKQLILVLLSARYSENIERDTITPGISFKIMNVSKDPVTYLKVKCVFLDKNKFIDEDLIMIADSKNKIYPNEISPVISSFSPTPINQVFSNHAIQVQIYISQSDPDHWKLYRNIYLDKRSNSSLVVR